MKLGLLTAVLRLPQVLRRRTTAIVAASAGPARTRHPVWLLVKKELHLSLYSAGVYGSPRELLAVPLAGVVALMLWFALENHRSAEHGAGRVSQQMIWMAGCLGLGAAVTAVVTSFH